MRILGYFIFRTTFTYYFVCFFSNILCRNFIYICLHNDRFNHKRRTNRDKTSDEPLAFIMGNFAILTGYLGNILNPVLMSRFTLTARRLHALGNDSFLMKCRFCVLENERNFPTD